ncbi:F-box/LRR-repeat protein At3g26922-like isoform X1 [Typha latifolia]|uniref:F-box/LRR-repeat protein At3g26922-like isoform X1 n=1 Tax=Typha latifolia TaxID=4733 RepID=UPI003C2C1F77
MAMTPSVVVTDRLSDLPDDLLLNILSNLPTHFSVRLSVLSRRFRHLWATVPSVDLECYECSLHGKFKSLCESVFAGRDSSVALVRLRLHCGVCGFHSGILSPWLSRALRHIDLHLPTGNILSLFPVILRLECLESLSISLSGEWNTRYVLPLPVPATCRLRRLKSLHLYGFRAIGELLEGIAASCPALKDVKLVPMKMNSLNLCSPSLRSLYLDCDSDEPLHLRLLCPSLEFLHFESPARLVRHYQLDSPALRSAVIKFGNIHHKHVVSVGDVIRSVANVSELLIHLTESEDIMSRPNEVHVLVDQYLSLPKFSNLKRLDVTACFTEKNVVDLISFLQHTPVLDSLNLTHEVPPLCKTASMKKNSASKLPWSTRGDVFASFTNLGVENKKKEVVKLLSQRVKGRAKAILFKRREPQKLSSRDYYKLTRRLSL